MKQLDLFEHLRKAYVAGYLNKSHKPWVQLTAKEQNELADAANEYVRQSIQLLLGQAEF